MNLLLRLREHLPKEIASEAFQLIRPPTEEEFINACKHGKSLLIEHWLYYGLVVTHDGGIICHSNRDGQFEITWRFLTRCNTFPCEKTFDMFVKACMKYGYFDVVDNRIPVPSSLGLRRGALRIEHGAPTTIIIPYPYKPLNGGGKSQKRLKIDKT